MGIAPRRIVVHVDEFALNGFPMADRDRVAAAFERELTRLLYAAPLDGGSSLPEGSLLARSSRSLDAIALPALPPAASSRRLGELLARAVHDGFTRGETDA
ncbi:hypothetical protein Ssi03_69000 [Sphaerisporangium siamense]|uniref:Uncharacterized protein n=1 Tax=Sphaerisporangium siamense TaxID=795645 RepID=A0A7W7D597_9ACTN|nr:hypothetical protein [Sphaerisporangium siamense]MBB4700559.1 hypothetical protein [Sphaerisporangium siamense]GII88910.1 hypothetical protein Ssi03_69000 [Sphaerisporangium siamense]